VRLLGTSKRVHSCSFFLKRKFEVRMKALKKGDQTIAPMIPRIESRHTQTIVSKRVLMCGLECFANPLALRSHAA
jgi:hypothetical protein